MRVNDQSLVPKMKACVPSILTGILIVVVGSASLAWVTDGFRAVVLETARRLELSERHPTVPDARVEDQFGNQLRITDLRGRSMVATFMYTRCTTLCSVTGGDLGWLQRALRGGRHPATQLLSVSFDAHDDRVALQKYARRYHAQWPGWRVVRIPDPIARQRFLRALGVVAISDGFGGYTHNAALYLIGPDGRVRTTFDVGRAPDVLADLSVEP
jgi:protein SCO1